MAIQISQSPTIPFDMAYGANPITLSGIGTITPLPDKYALRIYIVGQADPIADIRQTPNRVARAIFDAQNILQSYIGPSRYNIDGLNASSIVQTRPLHIANGELVEYQIAYNWERNGELGPTWTTSPTIYTVIAGSKPYNEVTFPANDYRPTVEETSTTSTLVLSVESTEDQLFRPDVTQSPLRFQDIILDSQGPYEAPTYTGWRNPGLNFYKPNATGTWRFVLTGEVTLDTDQGDWPDSPDIELYSNGSTYVAPTTTTWPATQPAIGVATPFECVWENYAYTPVAPGAATNDFLSWNWIDEPQIEDEFTISSGATLTGTFTPEPICADGTVMTKYGKPLSDNEWTITDQQTGDEWIQDGFSSPAGIDVHNVYEGDQNTKTFYSKVIRQGGQVDPMVQGLEQFEVLQYDGIFLTSSATVNNTQVNGGGPNVTPGQGLLVGGNFQTITIGTGPANLAVPLLPTTTHYYIIPTVWDQCDVSEAAWKAQRYNILPTACNDYPHIQFAWLNSKGFRDQFTFTKRNEKGIDIKRNEYLKESADYNSSNYSVDLQSRGYTTYSQTLKETWNAQTDYINDQEAELLESMFKSAQVMARFSTGEYKDQWVPVRLQSKKYTKKTNRKDRLFQYDVKFTIAQNIKSQRG